ncbi:MAG: hypothetical protein NC041_00275 [Bacteroides sp.]|nr:hypothetical protein [Prevotella sp.]MCM1408621.1 hypothetical protein [Treponema brennaborense]MCM1468891.1 hypothetical protein [Bacteroides sp.]
MKQTVFPIQNKKRFACAVCLCALVLCAAAADEPKRISAADMPNGWAAYKGTKDLSGAAAEFPSSFGGSGAKPRNIFTAGTREALLSALKASGAKIIYVDGMIDMTDIGSGTMLPPSAEESTGALDDFIAKTTKSAAKDLRAASWSEWKSVYAANVVSTQDHSGAAKDALLRLRAEWKKCITIPVSSNTTIIGLTEQSGFRGGSVLIRNVGNIVLRNLHIQDAFDPFPEMQANDGLNAEYDAVSVQSSKYVWIDHCTFSDTIALTDAALGSVKTKDRIKTKWQIYDGLCDITNTNDFVTVSWCRFENHDKTMLIGSSDKMTADENHQTITLHHNLFSGCTQRLPMVRFATIHIYNNVYEVPDGAPRKNTYAVGVRKNARIVAENNVFGSGIGCSFRDSGAAAYSAGNIDNSRAGAKSPLADAKPWNPQDYYESADFQSAEDAEKSVHAYAGAGVIPVSR